MHSSLLQITSKISSLSRCGFISQARKLFDEMLNRDTIAWNAMLSGYCQLGFYQETISLFRHMRISNTRPDHFTFTATLKASANASALLFGAKIHALVVVSGFSSSVPVNNSLIDMYGKCLSPINAGMVFNEMDCANEVTWCSLLFAYMNSGLFCEARDVFNSMPKKIDVAWNVMIAGFGQNGEIEMCLELFVEMLESSCSADQWTYSSLISACAEALELSYGCMIHAAVIKSGWDSAVEARNSILSFYAKLGSFGDAMKVFESTDVLTCVSWNAMIDAHMKNGDTHEAYIAFQRAPEKSVVSWTSMITGYARNGCGEEALAFFVGMTRDGLLPDDFTFGAVLHACSTLAMLENGRMVHGCIIKGGFHAFVYIGNGLVNMYSKCGDLHGSVRAFHDVCQKDLVSLNAMLFAFALHGRATQAVKLYEDMIASGTKPDKVTFLGLLMACSHSGLIERGCEFFESMTADYGLPHALDHVACMVDMLGRNGHLSEAKELSNKYSLTRSVKTSSSEALLGACVSHGEVDMGTDLGETLKALEPSKEMSYVLQSNLHCSKGQWEEAENVRKAMRDEGLKKLAGCSWIEVRNKMAAFVAGHCSYAYMEELSKTLSFLDSEMRNPSIIGFEKIVVGEIINVNLLDKSESSDFIYSY